MSDMYYDIDGKILNSLEDIILYVKKRLSKAEYLYGEKLEGIDKMLYIDALLYKIECSEKLVSRLLAVPYMRRDTSRIQESLAAQKFNRMLISESQE